MNDTPKKITDIDKKIQLLEQWRDWYWQTMLWNKAKNTMFVRDHLNIADGLDLAISLLRGEERVLPGFILNESYVSVLQNGIRF